MATNAQVGLQVAAQVWSQSHIFSEERMLSDAVVYKAWLDEQDAQDAEQRRTATYMSHPRGLGDPGIEPMTESDM